MRAAWYERQGPAREVLRVGMMADPLQGGKALTHASRRRSPRQRSPGPPRRSTPDSGAPRPLPTERRRRPALRAAPARIKRRVVARGDPVDCALDSLRLDIPVPDGE